MVSIVIAIVLIVVGALIGAALDRDQGQAGSPAAGGGTRTQPEPSR